MSTFKDLRNIILAAAAAGYVVGAAAQSASHSLPGGGWYYDPSVHGMLDLKAIRPIEGCNLPGGLTKITSSDEPGVSAPFWCGTPPFCLTDSATGVSESCTIMPYARRNPRYSPTGTPGVNSIRNPEDLRCGNTGLQPINSRCPIVPTARITFNNSTNLNVNTGASITVRVTTTNAKPEWGGSATLNCTGANANRSPFNSKNVALNVNNYSIGSGTVPSAGTLNCTLTVSNWRGTATATAKVTIKAPAPKPPSGGGGGGSGGGGSVVTTPAASRMVAGYFKQASGGAGYNRCYATAIMKGGSIVNSKASNSQSSVDQVFNTCKNRKLNDVTGAEKNALKVAIDKVKSGVFCSGLAGYSYYSCN